MSLDVTRKGITDVLDLCQKAEWQVPGFQREFVWTPQQVYELVVSIFKSRPIGLITLWAQPQGRPHTAHVRIKLRQQAFGPPTDDPAVMKLILDGRQRATALAIVFGGLRTSDDRFWFSGRYFLDLDADPDFDRFIAYKKRRDISKDGLDTPAVCIAKALVPLDAYREFNSIYNQNINNQEFYPLGQFPGKEIRESRSKRLAVFFEAFQRFQIPIAEIPEVMTLAEVCEVFGVLNTAGTKVSTFDLIHNSLYADTKGNFDLRGLFNRYREDFKNLGFLLDSDRQDYLCQIVTGCYLGQPEPYTKTYARAKGKALLDKDKEKSKVKSLRGGDLLETPTEFYETFSQNASKIDSYCFALMKEILSGEFSLKQTPYPASLILYLSLRWRGEAHPVKDDFTTDELSRLFRAFFWRNTLAGRYDQGFLTLFATDLGGLEEVLKSGTANRPQWSKTCNEALDTLFTSQYPRLSEAEVKEKLLDGDTHGAMKQAMDLFLYSRIRYDLVHGEELDRFSDEKDLRVQLHHIFPQKWCQDNRGSHKILQQNPAIIDSAANLIPLTQRSNNEWKTKSPSTAIMEFQLDSTEGHGRFSAAFIDDKSLEILASPSPDPEAFWEGRAEAIASEMCGLQDVS